ncbi:MAG: hypothetical protein IKQ70_10145 [Bacteroidales bacterium]|nr:hypothetical protein [Bacteroidales bacterium]
MKTLLTLFSASAMLMCACTADDNLYSQYRVFFKNAFITPAGSILESAGFSDTVKSVYDRGATVNGYFEYTDPDEIVKYGHCWSANSNIPVINSDSSNCTFFDYNSQQSTDFESSLSGLNFETEYYIRSFIITKSGTIGYNPNITKFTTSQPHDEWFACSEPKSRLSDNVRADGFSVTTVVDGDTITYFGLGRNAGQCFSDVYMFSSKSKKIVSLPPFKGRARWGVSAFVLNYTDYIQNVPVLCLYVGLGCSDPEGKTSYEKDFYVLDLTKKDRWEEVRSNYKDRQGPPFTGNERTGSVSFALGELGFLGLGENASGACHNDFYVFIMERDNNNMPNLKRGYFYTMTQPFAYGELTGASSFIIGDNAYIVGGKDNDGKYHTDLIHCILKEGTQKDDAPYYFMWEKKQAFPGDARAFGASMAVAGYGYYGTGENNDRLYSDFYRYDQANNDWLRCESFPYKNVSHSFGISGNDRCYLGGGYTGENSDSKYENFLWEYRP